MRPWEATVLAIFSLWVNCNYFCFISVSCVSTSHFYSNNTLAKPSGKVPRTDSTGCNGVPVSPRKQKDLKEEQGVGSVKGLEGETSGQAAASAQSIQRWTGQMWESQAMSVIWSCRWVWQLRPLHVFRELGYATILGTAHNSVPSQPAGQVSLESAESSSTVQKAFSARGTPHQKACRSMGHY